MVTVRYDYADGCIREFCTECGGKARYDYSDGEGHQWSLCQTCDTLYGALERKEW